jgi:hypothetical protein
MIFLSNADFAITPNLIDLGVKDYMYSTLRNCHDYRTHIYSYALNIIVLFSFLGITGTVLYYSYKQKPTEYELKQKMLKDQQYILSKIRYYQNENQHRSVSNITKLPVI